MDTIRRTDIHPKRTKEAYLSRHLEGLEGVSWVKGSVSAKSLRLASIGRWGLFVWEGFGGRELERIEGCGKTL
jgi:hypothetical protein